METTPPAPEPQPPAPQPALAVQSAAGLWTSAHWLTLALLALFYSVYVIAQWSLGYIDFGDGNYMYIGWRIALGDVVYRDILAPQPPMHLFLGALVWKIAHALNLAEPTYAFRCASLLLHLGTLALVVRLAWRAWGRPWLAVLAGAIFLWLPIGFWWSMAWQSEPLETVFLLLMILAALRGNPRGDLVAGVWAAFAALTNATAAPFLLILIIYILCRAPLRALRMILPCVLIAASVTVAMELWTEGTYLDTVIFKQVGTFPGGLFSAQYFAYAWGKLVSQGGNVLIMEGCFLFLALIGLARLLRESPLPPLERAGLAWYCIATLLALVYTTKGGTMDYIFSLSEPAVAILAAGELAAWARRWQGAGAQEPLSFRLPKLAGAALLLIAATLPALNFYNRLWNQRAPFEATEALANTVRRTIETHSAPGDVVLAPPFYAFLAQREIWGHFSELFIWNITYYNDVDQKNPAGHGWQKIRQMEQALVNREIPIVVLEMGQTGGVPEIINALRQHYTPLRPRMLATSNTRLGFFVPRTAPADSPEETARWNEFLDSPPDRAAQ